MGVAVIGTPVSLLTERLGSTATHLTTATFSTVAGRTYLILGGCERTDSVTPADPTITLVNGNGEAITRPASASTSLFDDTGATRRRGWVGIFRATGTGSGRQIQMAYGATQGNSDVEVIEFTNVKSNFFKQTSNSATANGDAAGGAWPSNIATVALTNNPTVGSAVFVVAPHAANNRTVTNPGTGFTLMTQFHPGNTFQYDKVYDLLGTTKTASVTFSGGEGGGIFIYELEPEDASVARSGTATVNIGYGSLQDGGKTILLDLTNDAWVAAGGTFDAQRQNIINGIDSAQSETHGWDAEMKAKIPVTDVVRTSATRVTITLSPQAGMFITAPETITPTVPSTAVERGGALVGATFGVYPVDDNPSTVLGGSGMPIMLRGRYGKATTRLIGCLTAVTDGQPYAPTFAAGDWKRMKDDGTDFENGDNLPTTIPSSGGKEVQLSFSAAEMTRSERAYHLHDQGTPAWFGLNVVVETEDHHLAKYPNGVIHAGVPQAIAAGTITLAASAPGGTGLRGCVVVITDSDNPDDVGVMAKISETGYDGSSSQVATLDSNWSRTPAGTLSTLQYAVLPDYKAAQLVANRLATLNNVSTSDVAASVLTAQAANDVVGTVVADAGNSATTFKASVDVGTDVRVGALLIVDGTIAGESRICSWTGTQVTVLSQASMPTALKQFSGTPANGVTIRLRPI